MKKYYCVAGILTLMFINNFIWLYNVMPDDGGYKDAQGVIDIISSNKLMFLSACLFFIAFIVFSIISIIQAFAKDGIKGSFFLACFVLFAAIFDIERTGITAAIFGHETFFVIMAEFAISAIPILLLLYFACYLTSINRKYFFRFYLVIVLAIMGCFGAKQYFELSDRSVIQIIQSIMLVTVLGILLSIYHSRLVEKKDVSKLDVVSLLFLVIGNLSALVFHQLDFSRFEINLEMYFFNLFCILILVSRLLFIGKRYIRGLEDALSSNKAKSDFLSNMSHEMRTPMNAIVGMTDIMLQWTQDEKNKEYLLNIKSSGNALLGIINDVLDFSKIESGKFEIVKDNYDSMSMFNDLGMIFLNRIGSKNIELIYEIDPEMPVSLYGDQIRIRQIIMNLMNNAIKYTEEGYVKLRIAIREIVDDDITLDFYISDSGQGIKEEDIDSLFDSFVRVDEKHNRNKEGTGLGLAITKNLVEMMEGSIDVSSVYGEGSVFHFELKQKIAKRIRATRLNDDSAEGRFVSGRFNNLYVMDSFRDLTQDFGLHYVSYTKMKKIRKKIDFFFVDAQCFQDMPKEDIELFEKWDTKVCVLENPMLDNITTSGISIVSKPLYSLNFCEAVNGISREQEAIDKQNLDFVAPDAHVLVVDDNDMNVKVLKGMLEPLKCKIDVATNGKEAVMMIQENMYQIVLMDHMMPIMDGVEATKKIREESADYYQNLPIIAVSANVLGEAKTMFIESGMDDFISKPIRRNELLNCIYQWLPKRYVVLDKSEEDIKISESESIADKKNMIKKIPGIDYDEGVVNSGSEKMFFELLNDFYLTVDSKVNKVNKLLEINNISEFTIEVHALKHSARLIGAAMLSDEFYELEKMGSANNISEIEKNTPIVMKKFLTYKERLKPLFAKNDTTPKVEVDKSTIIAVLRKIIVAMDSFDIDQADEALKVLSGYQLPDELQNSFNRLTEMILDVDMSGSIELSREMIEKINR